MSSFVLGSLYISIYCRFELLFQGTVSLKMGCLCKTLSQVDALWLDMIGVL